jgi:hypothetical protein
MISFASIRHTLDQLEARNAAEQVGDSKTWRYPYSLKQFCGRPLVSQHGRANCFRAATAAPNHFDGLHTRRYSWDFADRAQTDS